MLRLKFDSKLDFQIDAISSVGMSQTMLKLIGNFFS